MLLVAALAALGLALAAALGIYGVISSSVAQRTHEIGVRMALGASPGRVQCEVIFNTLRLTLVGLILGTIASAASGQLIGSLFLATSP